MFSYTNSLILDKVALIPAYYRDVAKEPNVYISDDEAAMNRQLKASDDAAKAAYQGLGFTVKQINARVARMYGGQIHCLTKHIPKANGVTIQFSRDN